MHLSSTSMVEGLRALPFEFDYSNVSSTYDRFPHPPPQNTMACPCTPQVEVEDAIRKGNDKFNKMITEQMQAREDLQRSGENKAKVTDSSTGARAVAE